MSEAPNTSPFEHGQQQEEGNKPDGVTLRKVAESLHLVEPDSTAMTEDRAIADAFLDSYDRSKQDGGDLGALVPDLPKFLDWCYEETGRSPDNAPFSAHGTDWQPSK